MQFYAAKKIVFPFEIVLPAKKRQNLGAFKEIEARLTYSCTFVC